ncbi:iron-siderophore ABC transporter substrate-binding protein [Gordonia humi]|uniref:Iron complex transport system substrate-binding protein n=1 Tax=Gordonia humi TaxID=686429 RepID=A0A840EYC1_9ACTN|nr:iron-siderophore ABC transporter substrate-binding protein [Gordonia humi]MBB4135324.1 iron complex transport system substrate-binding protein [Gordonia humi]
MRTTPRGAIAALAVFIVALLAAGCSSNDDSRADQDWQPITIEHALGTTVIDRAPERVATVAWANHEVPLALGVVPVGMARANFGDEDGDGLLPWVKDKLDELGGEKPVLFDETDGIDFEAVADSRPDVILAAYSGLSEDDYDKLSKIAPTVAYPETAWGTPWREMIRINSKAIGKSDEGEGLIASIEQTVAEKAAEHPAIKDQSVMFLTHVDTTDLSTVSFYTTHDTRAMFFTDLGMKTPPSIAAASAETDKFSLTKSAEQIDALADVDIIVTYGGDDVISALRKDSLLSRIPAIANDAVVNLPGDSALGTAANPTPLSITWTLDDYLDLLDKASPAKS